MLRAVSGICPLPIYEAKLSILDGIGNDNRDDRVGCVSPIVELSGIDLVAHGNRVGRVRGGKEDVGNSVYRVLSEVVSLGWSLENQWELVTYLYTALTDYQRAFEQYFFDGTSTTANPNSFYEPRGSCHTTFTANHLTVPGPTAVGG